MVEWNEKPIGTLLKFKNGLNKGKAFFGHGIPIINYMDVYKKDGIYSNEIQGRVDLTEQEIKRYEIRKGDVFFTRTSETPEEVGMSCVLLDYVTNGVFSGFVLRGRPITDELDIEYCKYCFQTAHVRNEIVGHCTHTTRALTNGNQLSKIYIPVPPRREQRAIASALSNADGYIAALKRLIVKKRDIKQGAIQELLRPKDEWEEKRLGTITNLHDNLRIPITESKREKGLVPYYGANGIQDYVKGYTHDGDFVLIAEDGANDISNYPVRFVVGKIWVNNHAHVISGIVGIADTLFLSYLLKSVDYARILVGGTRAKLNGAVLKEIDLKIPTTIAEQKQITAILSDMDAEIDVLMAKLNKVKLIKQGMMEQLLTGKIRLEAESNA